MEKTIYIIAGPTAGGKSALALTRARETNGAVINCDSRQIYDALPILTAQPSTQDMAEIPHHLYGALHPDESCSAGRWLSMAVPLIEEFLANDITPIVTGGTGLYFKALMEGLSPIPPVPVHIRDAAIQKQKELGNPAFYEALKQRDPATAALYHPMHTARLIHAWEILEATGKPLAHWQSLPKEGVPEDWVFDVTLVMPERDVLYARCNARFEQMMDMGAVEELEDFDAKVARGVISKESIMMKTIGADPIRAWKKGDITKEEAISLAQTETRQYAKRQITWFKNQIVPADNITRLQIVERADTPVSSSKPR